MSLVVCRFVVTALDGSVVELVSGGAQRAVTTADLATLVELLETFKLTEVDRHVRYLIKMLC